MLVGLVLLVAWLGWWVLGVTLLEGSARTDASTYGQFVLAAVGLVIAVIGLILMLKDRISGERPEPDIDKLTDALAVAVRAQWTAAATDRRLLHPPPLPTRWRRSPLPVAGPVSGATTPRPGTFDPLPGLNRTTPAQLREGTHRTLHRVYGGLASGRLIITGAPGSGKTSAAILLLLDALDFRDHTPADERDQIPVPVLFTLTGWNPATTTVHMWLAAKLTEFVPLAGRHGKKHAEALLAAGRIAVILDGLDEIPERHHAITLRALADQATFRLVLLTRTAELATAAQQQILTSAACLELRPLTPADVASYLHHSLPDPPPSDWQRLLDALTPTSSTPLAAALTNPLTVTLLRDIYHPPPPPGSTLGTLDELLDTKLFPTPDRITHHLLDHVIITAYTPKPGRPRPSYTPQTAHHTLTVIAQHLRDHDTHDLNWWQIPDWIPRTSRTRLMGISTWFSAGLLFGLMDVILGGGLTEALLSGLVVGLPIGYLRWQFSGHPAVQHPRQALNLTTELRGDLTVGLPVGLLIGLVYGLTEELVGGLLHGLLIGLVLGLAPILLISAVWPVFVGQLYLARKHHVPVRLLAFLADAHKRHLLRTVGPTYQFRHATLQDRLAPPHQPTTPPPNTQTHQ
ncbi:MAG: NACHT domain-containing protein [Umezawaea sp.]